MPTTHTLTKFDDAVFVTAGEIRFDERGAPTLTVTAGGELGQALRDAWTEISAQEALLWKRDEDTPSGTRLVGRRVPKGDPDYPSAVLSQLANRHGFLSTP